MTIDSAPADGSPEVSPAAATAVFPALPSWPWRRAALFLAGAAQLITISVLVGADPIPATWSSLLLAIAPAPLAGAVWGSRTRPLALTWNPTGIGSRQAQTSSISAAKVTFTASTSSVRLISVSWIRR
jgi:hypothetical protein